MINSKLIGLVSVSSTVTIAVINLTSNQIAMLKYFPDTTQLSNKIYSSLVGMGIEELYMGFDTQTVNVYNENVCALSSFTVGTMSKHSVITMEDLQVIQNVGQSLGVKNIRIFDYITMFQALSNDKNTVILENTPNGIRAVHVSGGTIQDYRVGANPNSIKSIVEISNAEMVKLFDINHANKYGVGLINFDLLEPKYKMALIPVLFMMYTPQCLDINPYGMLPQPKPSVINNRNAYRQEPIYEKVQAPKRPQQVIEKERVINRPIVKEEPSYEREEPLAFSIIGKVATVLTGIAIGVSVACTTQLPKQNVILMDTLQTIAASSNDISATSSYYDRLIAGISDPAKSNAQILSKIAAITEGGTVADITLKKNNVEVLILAENEENLNKFKESLQSIVSVGEVTNVGEVTVGETKFIKYKVFCEIK